VLHWVKFWPCPIVLVHFLSEPEEGVRKVFFGGQYASPPPLSLLRVGYGSAENSRGDIKRREMGGKKQETRKYRWKMEKIRKNVQQETNDKNMSTYYHQFRIG
jgi:hypothetical protein